VFQNLSAKDVNNVHLVCRNLHQIANLHVNQKLSFRKDSPGDLKSLVQSYRIFEELEFLKGSFAYLSSPEKFEILEEFIRFTGIYVKELTIREVSVDRMILLKFLSMLPNLKLLELNCIKNAGPKTNKNRDPIKRTKCERVIIVKPEAYRRFLKSMVKCEIRELHLELETRGSEKTTESLRMFFQAQEKSLKALLAFDVDLKFLNGLKDLRLKYLDYTPKVCRTVSLKFLRHQVDLKFLRLTLGNFSRHHFDLIFELKNLETLELEGRSNDSSGLGLENLHKLKKLKRLKVHQYVSKNILDHLQFGVFEDLEKLDAAFKDASVESVQEMSRIAPNLKTLEIQFSSSDQVNAFLETLAHLEFLKIWNVGWTITENIYPNLKYLHVLYAYHLNPDRLQKQFPNLEFLRFEGCVITEPQSFLAPLLSGLKQLKKFYAYFRSDSILDPETVLQCLQEHGNHLEDGYVGFTFPSQVLILPDLCLVRCF
jgi:hypothetical protein